MPSGSTTSRSSATSYSTRTPARPTSCRPGTASAIGTCRGRNGRPATCSRTDRCGSAALTAERAPGCRRAVFAVDLRGLAGFGVALLLVAALALQRLAELVLDLVGFGMLWTHMDSVARPSTASASAMRTARHPAGVGYSPVAHRRFWNFDEVPIVSQQGATSIGGS